MIMVTLKIFCHGIFWCNFSIYIKYNAKVHCRLSSHQLGEHIPNIFSSSDLAIIIFLVEAEWAAILGSYLQAKMDGGSCCLLE